MLRKRTVGLAALALSAIGVLAGVLIAGAGASATVSRASGPSGTAPVFTARLPVPILLYHYVDDTLPDAGGDAAALTVSTKQFEAEMDFLAERGYHPVTLSQVYASLTGNAELASKLVAITFDDGGRDNYTVVFPILRKHGFSATFFVITGYVGNRVCMSWDQLREMHAAGMEVESHTVRHPDLRRVDATLLSAELAQSRMTLVKELGVEAPFLSYPYGRYNNTVLAAARAAGYRAAVTTHRPGLLSVPVSPYVWQRTNISPHTSLGAFACIVEGHRRVDIR